MHRTSSGDRRQALQKEAQELARDARALQKAAARAPAARREAERLKGEADLALAEAEALKLQGPGWWISPCGRGRSVQAEPEGLQDLHITEMASRREGDRNIIKEFMLSNSIINI